MRISNIYLILIDSKKEVVITKRSLIAIKHLSSDILIYVYYMYFIETMGFFFTQIPAT